MDIHVVSRIFNRKKAVDFVNKANVSSFDAIVIYSYLKQFCVHPFFCRKSIHKQIFSYKTIKVLLFVYKIFGLSKLTHD